MMTMKLAVVTVCCHALVAPLLASQVGGPAPTATDAQEQLSMVMAASQRSLMIAMKHEKKAIKKAKNSFSQLISTESKALAAALMRYGESLSIAVGDLEHVANSTKASLSIMAQNSTTGSDSSFVEESAMLGGKVMVTEQKVLRLVSKRTSALHEGARRAMEPLEDSSDQLSRKLGDLSGILDKAQEVLDSAVDQAVAKKAANPVAQGAPAALLSLRHTLETAKIATDAQFAAADKQFSATLAEVGATVSADTAELKRQLVEAMQSEVQKLRHPNAAAVGAPPSLERLRGRKPAIVKPHWVNGRPL